MIFIISLMLEMMGEIIGQLDTIIGTANEILDDLEIQFLGNIKIEDALAGKIRVYLQLDRARALVNGKEVILHTAPQVINGRTLVPLRFISENLGFDVTWKGEVRGILIEN